MNITKISHCCLVLEAGGARILVDPGSFSVNQHSSLSGIDAILITHEHGDHMHVESLPATLKNNPKAIIITNSGVGKHLASADIAYTTVEGRAKTDVKGVPIEAYDGKHEEIYGDWGQVQNTGYFVADEFFFPGDAFFNPGRPVKTLALPVAGPWCRIGDSIRYALAVKPQKAFPVHDGMIKPGFGGFMRQIFGSILSPQGTTFVSMGDGATAEF